MSDRGSRGEVCRLEWSATFALWAISLAPLALIPGGLFRFTLPKLLLTVLGVGLAARAGSGARLPRAVSALIGGALVLLGVAAALSVAPVAQLLGRWPRYEGVVALPVYVGALWAGARLLGPAAPPRRLHTLESALSVAAIVVGLVAALESIGLRPFGGDAVRPGSLLGNATDEGLVGMIIASVLTLPALRLRRPLVVLGAVAAASTVVLSGSRAALLGMVIALTLIAMAQSRVRSQDGSGRAKARAKALLIVVGLVIGAAACVPATRERLLGGHGASATIDGRLLLWSDTWRLARDHLWTGIGPSGFVDAVAAGHSTQWALRVGGANPPDSPHLWPFQALLGGGVPLIALCIALGAIVLGRVGHACRAAATDEPTDPAQPDRYRRPDLVIGSAAAMIAYGVALLTHFTSAGTTPLALLLVGGLIAAPRSARRAHPASGTLRGRLNRLRPDASIAVPVLAGVWSLALTLGVTAEIYLASAVRHAAAGDVTTAETRFDQAARLRPWDPDIALIAAQAYYPGVTSGDQLSAARAAAWSDLALERTPGSVDAARIRGFSLGALGALADGRLILEELSLHVPQDASVRLAAGVLAAQGGDILAAEDHFLVAVRFNPDDPLGWQDLAILYRYAGRFNDAAAAQRTADTLVNDA